MAGVVSIDVYSDISCPWCFIGGRRLQRVLRETADLRAEVRHHPYLLNPDAPREGVNVHARLAERYGSDPTPLFARVEAAAREEGIEMDLSRQPLAFDTAAAHTLVRHAAALGTQSELLDALFEAYFVEGLDISDTEVLVRVAAPHGFDAEQVRALVESDPELSLTRMEAADASRRGVQGVPFFVLAGRYALSGAQPAEVFVSAIRRAAQEIAAQSVA